MTTAPNRTAKISAIVLAILAAAFYAINAPAAKTLLDVMPVALMAGFLYLGAGVGMSLIYAVKFRSESPEERIHSGDWPFVVAMIVLDIAAPILMMLGLKYGLAANASLLGNFEIVATTVIALLIFRETVSPRLWYAIALITAASAILTLETSAAMSWASFLANPLDSAFLEFSAGSVLVLLATLCWGVENNCTRRIAERSTYQIVILKGVCSGAGALFVAAVLAESLPGITAIAATMLLGFISYGLSVFLYVRAQRYIGAAKTSAFYAVTPFIGAFLAVALLRENLTVAFGAAGLIMVAGTILVVVDTFIERHKHEHSHHISLHLGGQLVTVAVSHSHAHDHRGAISEHSHRHSRRQLRLLHAQARQVHALTLA